MSESAGRGAADLDLARAIDELSARAHRRSVMVANDVLRTAVRSSRRSVPVRAHAPWDFVHVGDNVLIAKLRRRIDEGLAGAAVGRIVLDIDRDQSLRSLTIELFVQYGLVLVDVGDAARLLATEVLVATLGGPTVAIDVTGTHVHVSDVTVGDPHLVEPGDPF